MDKISERAVTKIVAAAVASVPGTSVVKPSVGRTFPRFDVQLDDDGDTATIEAFIAVTWPAPLLDVAETVRETIVEHVHTLTGIKVLACNVVVGPVVAGEGRVLVEDLALPPLVTTPITVRGIR
ncbi:Asp23/Gls24 family envelope stress response protein [Corynebacterium hindlerae]|uniref:Asp23/Gls24 family envelope stress response protein n=1 Tax=Corynebacterium hindlerae TaxID=699041 RepID=UPI001AD74819|nr:Asp23/Gls24 family envelope stress response protein [Corynebacterium hindlerae]QTH60194.1 Asp23/Gls24 family envelope stress response protein [Corynebacterium hindlerae]